MVSNPHVPILAPPRYMKEQMNSDYQRWRKKQIDDMSTGGPHRKTRTEHFLKSKEFRIRFRDWQIRVLGNALTKLRSYGNKNDPQIKEAITIMENKQATIEGWLKKHG